MTTTDDGAATRDTAEATPAEATFAEATSTQATDPSATDVGALASDLRLACMRISRRVRFEQGGGPTIAPHRFSVLVRLEPGPLPVTRLAEIERVSAPSMTRTVGGLVTDGLAVRTDNPRDGRQVLVSITDAGRDVVAATRARRDLWVSSRVAALSADEVAALAAAAPVLAKVADL